MSVYALQKLIREINLRPDVRARFMESGEAVADGHPLSDEERSALIRRDYGALYRMGVHGLLLRPLAILHKVSEPDYLAAIREDVV